MTAPHDQKKPRERRAPQRLNEFLTMSGGELLQASDDTSRGRVVVSGGQNAPFREEDLPTASD
jgi:hypothetical protein